MIWFIIICLFGVIFYYKTVKPLSYWKNLKIPYITSYPIIGSLAPVFLRRISFFHYIINTYRQFPKERYYGTFQFSGKGLFIKDPDLIKKITIKDFDYFSDHKSFPPTEADPLVQRNLFNLTGQRWRNMRGTLSPTFTSSKMKIMFSLISKCSNELTSHFEKQENTVHEVEMKDVFTRFSNDVIASTAFGVECNSFENQNNEFYVMAKKSVNITGFKLIKVILSFLFPKIAKVLSLKTTSNTVTQFFHNIIHQTINIREEQHIIRPDVIHLLMEARKGKNTSEEDHLSDTGFATVEEVHLTNSDEKFKLTDEDITAQALGFIFGGFDTTSSVLSFVAYELGTNPIIQEKLHNEIDETLISCNGKLTYEALNKMKYMDMVVSETLRKWPLGFLMDRMCVKDYTIEPVHPWENTVVLKKGDMVFVPVSGFHHDPQYYPNPEVFDPERFSEENKSKILPCTYFPFGSGPRSCIASRFALMETKNVLFHLLSKFEIVPTRKTPIPLKVDKASINFVAEGGFWLGLKQRIVL